MPQETLQQRIARHEGYRANPYKDKLGNLTIGIGRCLDTKGITRSEAEYLMNNDINEATHAVDASLPWALQLASIRREVLIEMAFQMGIGGLLQFRNMLNALEKGDIDTTVKEMLDSAWAKQTPERSEEFAGLS